MIKFSSENGSPCGRIWDFALPQILPNSSVTDNRESSISFQVLCFAALRWQGPKQSWRRARETEEQVGIKAA